MFHNKYEEETRVIHSQVIRVVIKETCGTLYEESEMKGNIFCAQKQMIL